MKNKFVDCFMLMSTALSMKDGQKLPEVGRPVLQNTYATIVNLSITVQEFKILNFPNLEVEIGALMNQKWMDSRLGINNLKTRKMATAGQIWKPKILPLNAHNQICNNEDTTFWRGFGNEGRVLLSEKLRLRVPCTGDFYKFPFDAQICELKIGSFRFPEEEVKIKWDINPVSTKTDLDFNEFQIINITTYITVDERSSGNFTVATVNFIIKRHPETYILSIMLPSFLLVFLNYVPFWFKLNKRSTRFNLNIGTLVTSYYFYYVSVYSTYRTPYLKAVDIFVIISILFSLITFTETIIVDFVCTAEETQFHLKKMACSKEYPKCIYWIEFGMKLLYPVFYTFLMILYGLIYFE